MTLLTLFLTFFKIGLFTFGGGYAMLPLIQSEVAAHNWLTAEELVNFIAVSESTPGPFAVNISTYVGMTVGGLFGAVCATLGVVLPSFFIILLIAAVLNNLLKYKPVNAFLDGLRPCVAALILGTAVTMILKTVGGISDIHTAVQFDWKPLVLFAILAGGAFAFKKLRKKAISPILLIVISAGLGMLFFGVIQ